MFCILLGTDYINGRRIKGLRKSDAFLLALSFEGDLQSILSRFPKLENRVSLEYLNQFEGAMQEFTDAQVIHGGQLLTLEPASHEPCEHTTLGGSGRQLMSTPSCVMPTTERTRHLENEWPFEVLPNRMLADWE